MEWGGPVLLAGGQLQQFHGHFGGLRFAGHREADPDGENLNLWIENRRRLRYFKLIIMDSFCASGVTWCR